NINVRLMMCLTRGLIPTLSKNSLALIMNLDSMTQSGLPYHVIYSAWCKGLNMEAWCWLVYGEGNRVRVRNRIGNFDWESIVKQLKCIINFLHHYTLLSM
ncbi:hypothetical protein F5882DRAFT_309714, partial [Hyaloscypha sp. PMI_1271]